MERSLDDSRPSLSSTSDVEQHDGLKVTFPLLDCIQTLKEKHHTVSRLHRERYEQVKKLVEALDSYASHLEPSFVQIKLPPTSPSAKAPPTFDLSPTYVGKLDQEFTRVYEEYNRRVASVSQIADEIINLWSELGTPQAQVDSHIVQYAHDAPEQLGLHQEDLKRLAQRRDKLVAEKQQRERKLKELRANVESLWDRLGVEPAERKAFLAANRGCGLRQINEFEDELSKLNELKRQNLHIFVEDARFKLQELWDGLYFSEEEMLDFAPAFSHEYTDALLSAHEHEIARLEALKAQRAPILAAIDKHRSLINEREELEKSSQDASRLMAKGSKGEKRDPGKLLREEKMRKRIAKELPKVEADLRKALEAYEDEYGRPFCVHGNRYLDELESSQAKVPPPRSKTPNALSRPAAAEPPRSGRSRANTMRDDSARANGTRSRANTMREAAPPRSKTPSGPPRSKTPTGPPKMLSSTRNPLASSVLGSSVSAHASSGKLSPSKIPSATRLPMSTMRDGQNSPERQKVQRPLTSHANLGHMSSRSEDLGSSLRGHMGPPPSRGAAPPPKMKDFFVPPTPSPAQKENYPDPERSGSVIRHMEPEDPYTNAEDLHSSRYRALQSSTTTNMGPPPRPAYPRNPTSQDSYASSAYRPGSAMSNASSAFSSSRPISRQTPGLAQEGSYPMAPPSRQMSNTSSIMSGHSQASGASGATSGATSGSENWETYTDASETEEADATEAYWDKVRQQQMRQKAQWAQQNGFTGLVGNGKEAVKRPATAHAGMWGSSKRFRDEVITEERCNGSGGGEARIVSGSEAGWTDEGDEGEAVVGETY
jgi:Ase1/PRC1/MAP65 family protein